MSIRTYFLIGFVIGGIIYLVGQFAGADIVEWADDQQREARLVNLRPVGQIVMEPVALVFNPDQLLVGAILGGFLWPLTVLWPILILIHIVAVSLSDAVDDAALQGMIHWIGWRL